MSKKLSLAFRKSKPVGCPSQGALCGKLNSFENDHNKKLLAIKKIQKKITPSKNVRKLSKIWLKGEKVNNGTPGYLIQQINMAGVQI